MGSHRKHLEANRQASETTQLACEAPDQVGGSILVSRPGAFPVSDNARNPAQSPNPPLVPARILDLSGPLPLAVALAGPTRRGCCPRLALLDRPHRPPRRRQHRHKSLSRFVAGRAGRTHKEDASTTVRTALQQRLGLFHSTALRPIVAGSSKGRELLFGFPFHGLSIRTPAMHTNHGCHYDPHRCRNIPVLMSPPIIYGRNC